MTLTHITIHTDGSCKGNPGPGGWAAILRRHDDTSDSGDTTIKTRSISGSRRRTTNNEMELTAALRGLQQVNPREPLPIIIYSDSKYLVQGMTEWVDGWAARSWKTKAGRPAANKDLWEALMVTCGHLSVQWHWVKAHNGDAHNERADKLASEAADRALRIPAQGAA